MTTIFLTKPAPEWAFCWKLIRNSTRFHFNVPFFFFIFLSCSVGVSHFSLPFRFFFQIYLAHNEGNWWQQSQKTIATKTAHKNKYWHSFVSRTFIHCYMSGRSFQRLTILFNTIAYIFLIWPFSIWNSNKIWHWTKIDRIVSKIISDSEGKKHKAITVAAVAAFEFIQGFRSINRFDGNRTKNS